MNWIKIGGQERPIHFSNRLAYTYEATTGRTYLADVSTLFQQFSAVSNGSDTIEEAATKISVVLLADLAHCALKQAHRAERLTFDYEPEDVGAWLLDDAEAVTAVVVALAESLPVPDADDDEAKKKTTARTKATRSK